MPDDRNEPIDVAATPPPAVASTVDAGLADPPRPIPLPFLIFVFSIINLIAVPTVENTRSEFLVALVMGFVLAELMTTSAIAVLGRGPWIARWAGVFAIEALLLLFTVTGISLSQNIGPGKFREMLLTGLTVGPLVSLSAKLPMLPLRLVWGLHLRAPGDAESGCRTGQFGIGDMLVVTALTAFCLGMAQYGLNGRNLGSLLIICVVTFAAGLFVGVPATLVAFKIAETAIGCAIMLFHALALSVAVFVVLCAIAGPPRDLGGEQLFFLLALLLAACATTQLSLRLVRAYGYELARGATVPVVAILPAEPAVSGDAVPPSPPLS